MAPSATAHAPGARRLVAPPRPETDVWASPDVRRYARARRVARDLVELSRLDRGAERADRAQLDLAQLVRAIGAERSELAIAGPASAVIETDSRRLAGILLALLDNASRHGAPPVTLRFGEAGVEVADSGPGFAPRLLEHATEPFVTGDRSRPRGLGLGLALAARQATLLDATLELANGERGGARVSLRFAPGTAC